MLFFSDSEDLGIQGIFYGFPVRGGDIRDKNFDLDGFKSDEEDGENLATNDKQEARWNDKLDNIQVPDFVAATARYFVLDNHNE